MEISLEKYDEMQDRIANLETANDLLSKKAEHALDLVIEREDVIYALRAKQPHWISVKDRLPKNDWRVLVYDKYLGIAEGYCISADDTWWLYYPVKRIFPSYWMPLPEPPEVEDVQG